MGSAIEKSTIRKPFIDHVRELQKRLIWMFLAVLGGIAFAYSISEQLLDFVQKPLGQHLYYTSPMGGFTSLFKLCLAMGIVIALPVLLYNIFRFLQPLVEKGSFKLILGYTLVSILLGYSGVAFAYYISLPSSLHFLSQFAEGNFESIITADEYFNFALTYIAGFAILFQLPLIIMFINRINPLSPIKMMKAQRYIIVGSFIVAAILTPTPDPINQALMALPAILLYQVSVVMVLVVNKKRKTTNVKTFKKESQMGAALQTIPVDSHFSSEEGLKEEVQPTLPRQQNIPEVVHQVQPTLHVKNQTRKPNPQLRQAPPRANGLVMDMVIAQRN